jgi:hypothetical protein
MVVVAATVVVVATVVGRGVEACVTCSDSGVCEVC